MTFTKSIISKVLKTGMFILVYALGVSSIYLIVAVVLSIIPVKNKQTNEGKIDIYLYTNGVHLDLVFPVRNEVKDWSYVLHMDERILPYAKYVSFGWGDKNFYIDVPTWSELTLNTALNAVFKKSESAIHVDFFQSVPTANNTRSISVSIEQYQELVDYVEAGFQYSSDSIPLLIRGLSYHNYDLFYEANGSYSLFFTCNTWTNKALKEAGLKACLWTPFDRGTLFHYR
jgi:uncharacterized protein (TIGR02117 family)